MCHYNLEFIFVYLSWTLKLEVIRFWNLLNWHNLIPTCNRLSTYPQPVLYSITKQHNICHCSTWLLGVSHSWQFPFLITILLSVGDLQSWRQMIIWRSSIPPFSGVLSAMACTSTTLQEVRFRFWVVFDSSPICLEMLNILSLLFTMIDSWPVGID